MQNQVETGSATALPAYVGRFAPSPSGRLHFGSLVAAVGSYLQARCAHGEWHVRIEDIDTLRVVPGAADDILKTLAAFGFEWDGTVEYQSKRLEYYAAALDRLRKGGFVYECSCSRAQIAASLGENFDSEIDEPRYLGTCRKRAQARTKSTASRFLVPDIGIELIDRIQGPQLQPAGHRTDDFIIRRRDNIFAYHLAVVIDDNRQGITEVVRGCDLLSSTPRHIHLQRALAIPTPRYAHLPLVSDEGGRKLSKSAQSLPIVATNAPFLLWQTLSLLRQSPPLELQSSPASEIWSWAIAHWNLGHLQDVAACMAPLTSREERQR